MRHELVQRLMDEFAESTGLTCRSEPRRYLWTDAFAVCNFLGLRHESGRERYLQLARDLVDQVHHILGRHRQDDPRSGWISGLSEADGARHPTYGGLRIGKRLNEREAGKPANPRLEWDQDGQYFHYLTKWMHALTRMSQDTGDTSYLRWAAELAVAAHRSFVYPVRPHGPKRMFWKMSIDLRRPLVDSMGHHDPLDGMVGFFELRISDGIPADVAANLDAAIDDFSQMCDRAHWVTDDPLGIGGLLDDALRLAELAAHRGIDRRELLLQLLGDARASLQGLCQSSMLDQAVSQRLAFRELGLSIGLRAVPLIVELVSPDAELARLAQCLTKYEPLRGRIETLWTQPVHRESRTWQEHHDINTVMLATSLAPDSYLAA
ncbi:MAG: hypothetical protein KDA63_00300 [Planctomycetales bacterium]|nr:hypothetical protein [Planctomycetales bacterium]